MESWIIYSIIAASLAAISIIIAKKVLQKEHSMEYAATLKILLLIFSITLIPFADFSNIGLREIGIIYAISAISTVAFILITKAIKHSEVSSVSPIMVLSPGIIAITSYIFLKESLSSIQFLGISILIIGAYVLESKNHQKLFDPFKKLIVSKYSRYVLLAIILYGFTAVMERYLLTTGGLQVQAYFFIIMLFMSLNLFILLSVLHNGYKGVIHGIKKGKIWIFIVAFITFLMLLSQVFAIQLAHAGLVVAIKRMSVLLVIILGGEIFHENDILKKILASLIMIVGVVLITI